VRRGLLLLQRDRVVGSRKLNGLQEFTRSHCLADAPIFDGLQDDVADDIHALLPSNGIADDDQIYPRDMRLCTKYDSILSSNSEGKLEKQLRIIKDAMLNVQCNKHRSGCNQYKTCCSSAKIEKMARHCCPSNLKAQLASLCQHPSEIA
jgi:hypothetical protein